MLCIDNTTSFWEEFDLTPLYYGAAIVFCALTFLFLFLCRNKSITKRFTNTQLVALLYSALFFIRFFGGNPLIQSTIGLNIYSPFGPQGGGMVALAILLFWLIYAVQLAAITYPFFEKHIPLVSPIVRYVATVVYAGSIVALPILNRAQDGDLADEYVVCCRGGQGRAYMLWQCLCC